MALKVVPTKGNLISTKKQLQLAHDVLLSATP